MIWEDAPAWNIEIQPLGAVNVKQISAVRDGLKKSFNGTVSVRRSIPLPKVAFYPSRGRYRAERLITFLTAVVRDRHTKVIGLTAADISTTKDRFPDWGVFGLGNVGGKACVVSTFRLKGSRAFAQAVAIHEVGHTFGLNHCPHRGCVMQDAKGTIQTLKTETGQFCGTCRTFLAKEFHSVLKR